ncbi:hypothetical protein QBC33DRAFT_214854 [Phialemonium atrogriseum]|uniref:EKC/KEOPS complex subunit BUD32 n=1 Tax=Phialemonium atrogriseum TaxID=1093897 RepID=A0AAJ0BSN9_9PEZI|nr:uncharacterized protein QBC33DRAFT_214854 [Phialemonium atrogriseum]KAK1763764.1 hypothetical protein QBC33DRAFT_214854 [Phialemonium atrogriseum]
MLSPYRPGVTLAIRAHTPPHPFGRHYSNEDTIRQTIPGLKAEDRVDRLDFALSNPPLKTPPPAQGTSHVLTLLKKMEHRQERSSGAHVVSCDLDSDKSCRYVAKIYDGVDYPLVDYRGFDYMYLADQDYSCEAAAYQSIPEHLQGSTVPRYFGSWTCSVETGIPGRHRSARLILLEHVDGECMLDMILHAKGVTRASGDITAPVNYQLLPPEPKRLDVLAKIIEAEIELFQAGIVHRDVAPRNVIISCSPMRIALIDFNLARVHKHYESGRKYLASRDPMRCPHRLSSATGIARYL